MNFANVLSCFEKSFVETSYEPFLRTFIIAVSGGGLISERWHPLLNNLGHACRKNGKFNNAIRFHEKALTIVPGCGATYASLGLCLALSGDVSRSLDAFHSSLARRPDDTFASTMLTYLVDHLGEQAVIG